MLQNIVSEVFLWSDLKISKVWSSLSVWFRRVRCYTAAPFAYRGSIICLSSHYFECMSVDFCYCVSMHFSSHHCYSCYCVSIIFFSASHRKGSTVFRSCPVLSTHRSIITSLRSNSTAWLNSISTRLEKVYDAHETFDYDLYDRSTPPFLHEIRHGPTSMTLQRFCFVVIWLEICISGIH